MATVAARNEITRASGPAVDVGLLVLRLALAALMFYLHGYARFGRAYGYAIGGAPWPFVDLVAGLGFPLAGLFAVASALSESVGALLLGAGVLARWAAAVLAMDMAVALYNEISGGDPPELPALYFVGFVTLIITGPGRYTIAALWRNRSSAG